MGEMRWYVVSLEDRDGFRYAEVISAGYYSPEEAQALLNGVKRGLPEACRFEVWDSDRVDRVKLQDLLLKESGA